MIVDSEIVFNDALASVLGGLGHPVGTEEALIRYCGYRWSDCHRLIEADLGRALDSLWLERLVDAAAEDRIGDINAIAGLETFLKSQSPRHLAIASSSSRDWLQSSLERIGLSEYFGDRLFSASGLDRGKPHPDVYLLAAGILGLPPAGCLVIEDQPVGVAAGVAAGMTVIGLLAASHIREGHGDRLSQAGAHAVARDFEEAGRIIRRLEGG